MGLPLAPLTSAGQRTLVQEQSRRSRQVIRERLIAGMLFALIHAVVSIRFKVDAAVERRKFSSFSHRARAMSRAVVGVLAQVNR